MNSLCGSGVFRHSIKLTLNSPPIKHIRSFSTSPYGPYSPVQPSVPLINVTTQQLHVSRELNDHLNKVLFRAYSADPKFQSL